MTKNLVASREEVIRRMVDEAQAKGADAVLAMRFDTSEMGGNWTEICAYGTAVKIRKLDPSGVRYDVRFVLVRSDISAIMNRIHEPNGYSRISIIPREPGRRRNMDKPSYLRNTRLAAWVDQIESLCKPSAVHWCDGSRRSRGRCATSLSTRAPSYGGIRAQAEQFSGRAPTRATSPASKTAPSSARRRRDDAGPTNNWEDPQRDAATLQGLVRRLHARPHACM